MTLKAANSKTGKCTERYMVSKEAYKICRVCEVKHKTIGVLLKNPKDHAYVITCPKEKCDKIQRFPIGKKLPNVYEIEFSDGTVLIRDDGK